MKMLYSRRYSGLICSAYYFKSVLQALLVFGLSGKGEDQWGGGTLLNIDLFNWFKDIPTLPFAYQSNPANISTCTKEKL